MPVIDVHAHVTPQKYKDAIATDGRWLGLGPEAGQINFEGFRRSDPDRVAEMDALGVDIQLVTPTVGFYQYDNSLDATTTIAQACNDSVVELSEKYPGRFLGLATLPMQDIPTAVEEMTRAMKDLGMKGVVVSDHINGKTFDQPEFLPFFQAAERLGALVFFHQSGDTVVNKRLPRYSLPNAVGNLTERTLAFSAVVFGGVMDKCPDLKILLAHGGGYTTFGAGRLDKVAGAFEGGYPTTGLEPPFGRGANDYVLTRPPSSYLTQFYYDCCTYDGHALRYIIDRVGPERVMLGTDYPAPMLLLDCVEWVKSQDALTQQQKDAILSDNATALLGL
jgi:aminocarboxymuconate-semialdehyde decarboxylase